jgi:hypothetical protein
MSLSFGSGTTRLRLGAATLLLVALFLWLGIASPARREIADAQRQFARARENRERVRLRAAEAEHRLAYSDRLAAASPGGAQDPVGGLRRVALQALASTALSAAEIEVTPARPPAAARTRLQARGSFREALRLCEQLTGPESGVAMERVQLTSATGSTLRVDLDGFTLQAAASPPTAPARPAPPLPPLALDSVRDSFRYGDAPLAAARTTPRPRPAATPSPAETPPPEPAFRLVGVVRREGRLRAAISLAGEVVLLLPGESAGGVTILAVHDDGVRLRGPDGLEQVLPIP